MDVRAAYNTWSKQYDTSTNRTRDLEGNVLRKVLEIIQIERVLEIGCGTGKNTEWLVQRAKHITAVDLSEGMLAKAREKISSDKVRFVQADILEPWTFCEGLYDLVTFSLVLEHVEHLGPVLKEAASHLAPRGQVYIGELHPFKQYAGTKARFETEKGTEVVTCFDHHVSDFLDAARSNELELVRLGEHFDADDLSRPPRILSLLLRRA
ncbi:MAG: class I SAM-dependent methyltransferase [Flavobacteriales bacterium]|nr:class I SAM-dependent methyltransferase [Flavobacteriales bacterium]